MKTEGMIHQLEGLRVSDGKRNFAFLMEQGTGKTWLTMADAERCFLAGKIDALCVIAPNGVHSNWTRLEIPRHMSIPTRCYTWRGTPKTKKALKEVEDFYKPLPKGVMPVFVINVEALNFENGYDACERFIKSFRAMVAVDESTRIKNHEAKRAKKVVELGRHGTARRILSGTPLTKRPTDLFMQYHFLREGLLGTKSFRAFNSQFSILLQPGDPGLIAIMRKLGGKCRGVPQINAKDDAGNPMFQNLDKLSAMIAPHSFRVTKKDCLDLPEKVYKVIPFPLSPAQRKLYNTVREEYSYLLDTGEGSPEDVSFEAIAARTKLKQLTSGFINIYGEPQLLPMGENPRMDAFKGVIESVFDTDPDGSIIVWAMFELEIIQIKEYFDSIGVSAATYYGATKPTEREQIIDKFQAREIRVFIGHAAAAGIGITLTAAETAIYYSCSDDNELRLQSEDRNHRIGTKNTVVYYDLIAEDTLDEKIALSNAFKTHIAAVVIDGKKG